MAQCERLEGCSFFKKIKNLPKTAMQLAAIYCHGDNRACARLWLVASGVHPPDDLFPNEKDRALRLLSESGKNPAFIVQAIESISKVHK